MYFSKCKGKQTLDLKGNLILSKNAELVAAASKSSSPNFSTNPHYVLLAKLNRRQKLVAMWVAFNFIWSE